ncbi:MAG: SDR family NAD(P)-dependent oxidoreductase [Gammaproteobacteria bacterium]
MSKKVSLVVGGTSGIGLATAKAYAAAGYTTVIAGRNPASGEQIAARHGLLFYACDVTDPDSPATILEAIVNDHGQLDAAFNNAGWEGPAVPTDEITEQDWLTMINTKLNGVWRCMSAELKVMKKQSRGAIVNMAGNWGLVGFPNYASYCAAAHGIMGLTKAAAMEYAALGIRINAVCPGAVDAPMLDRMVGGNAEIKSSFGQQLAIGRICTAEEVAAAVVWLSSPAASYVNGVGLNLDGGG